MYRVNCYIRYGWDQYLIDPDQGVNSRHKLTSLAEKCPDALPLKLLQAVPDISDAEWTTKLFKLPKITFGTIYDFLVDRKVLLRKVSDLESVADRRAELVCNSEKEDTHVYQNDRNSGVLVEYTRTLEKAYRFFKDGHVQDVKYHSMPKQKDHICIVSKVLPSMKKDRVYNVVIVICESTTKVSTAYCACPAGLAGCCNHITATLYCLEDYIHQHLYEDEEKGCTDRLQAWNRPRRKNVNARPTDEVRLSKHEYGVVKRPKLHSVNDWDCRPVSRRIIDPNKSRILRERLDIIGQYQVHTANAAFDSASNDSEKKKAYQKKCTIEKYGTSCFLQLLDGEAAPAENRLEQLKRERLELAAAKKQKFKSDLSAKLLHLNSDHCYCASNDMLGDSKDDRKTIPSPKHLVNQLYRCHVCLDSESKIELERNTHQQHRSEVWHMERKLRITASIMKDVCHRKETTSCHNFIQRKLMLKHIDTKAVQYGRNNEESAIKAYLNYQHQRGISVNVYPCGLYVDSSEPWLAASPDGIVVDMSLSNQSKGCLEVKCPLVCERTAFVDACKTVAAFCLVQDGEHLSLSKSHGFYYQVQTQMHITRTMWCDFVVWSPTQDPFVQRVQYDVSFMNIALSKARNFYFDKFLPSVIPYIIITPVDTNTGSDSSSYPSTCNQVNKVSNPMVTESASKSVMTTTNSPIFSTTARVPMTIATPDVQFIGSHKYTSSTCSFDVILKDLNVKCHSVSGDGSCLYHAVAHQAGLINKDSKGDRNISKSLRQLTQSMMTNHPEVRVEDGLTKVQWLQKKMTVLDSSEWGGDLELRLLAIGIQRDIVVITVSDNCGCYARKYPCQPPPLPKMRGGIFIPMTAQELCGQWKSLNPSPLLLIYNGHNHYNSTLKL